MALEESAPLRGRLANVSVALLTNGDHEVEMAAAWLGSLFEDVLHVGACASPSGVGTVVVDEAASELTRIHAACKAAREERVLIWDPALALPAPVLLALCAWPEHDVVSPALEDGVQPLRALYRRDRVLETIANLARDDAASLLDALELSSIEGEDLAPLLA